MNEKLARKQVMFDLHFVSNAYHKRVSKSLARHGIQFFQSSYHNKIRLLNIRCWSIRYAVSLDWIIDHLLEYFSKQRRGAGNNLGISIASFTGDKAHEVILGYIEREYPGGENLDVQRSEFQQRMLAVPTKINVNRDFDVDRYVRVYQRKAARLRDLASKGPEKYTRAWRTNPWR